LYGRSAVAERPTDGTDGLLSSRLIARGGFEIVPRMLSRSTLMAMFDEATRAFPGAKEERRDEPDDEDWRGGLPPRRLLTAAGGPVQDSVYCSPAVVRLLGELVGVRLRPSSNRATYSYYCRPGDGLALHRDVVRCDISVIVVVSDNGDHRGGGELVVYPDALHQPLGAVRADLDSGAVTLCLAPGETVVIAGGMLPHRVLPVAEGHYRISAPMCYEVLPC
jgi:hypothetical protein